MSGAGRRLRWHHPRDVRRRLLAWILVTPVATAGVLVTHALAYRLTGTKPGPMHEYLAHVPQVVFVLASLALVGLALQERSLSRFSSRWVAPLAPLGFACQEHIERLVHTGQLPFLLTSPTFLVGLALQVPVAAVCVVLVRRVIGTLPGPRHRRDARPGGAWLPLTDSPPLVARPMWRARPASRGPPALLRA
jgi:hypothetical protein